MEPTYDQLIARIEMLEQIVLSHMVAPESQAGESPQQLATTTGDSIPYPSDPNTPADVIAAMTANANAVQTALNKRVQSARRILAGNGISGGGDLSTDRTISAKVAAGWGLKVDTNGLYIDEAVLNTLYAVKTHTHTGYAATNHSHSGYAATNHSHQPKQVGFRYGYLAMGTIGAGDTKTSANMSRATNEVCISLIVYNPGSTYLFPVVNYPSATSFNVEVRNSTAQTDHTDVRVSWTLMENN